MAVCGYVVLAVCGYAYSGCFPRTRKRLFRIFFSVLQLVDFGVGWYVIFGTITCAFRVAVVCFFQELLHSSVGQVGTLASQFGPGDQKFWAGFWFRRKFDIVPETI